MKEINVSEPWFSYIKKKKKTVEGRLNKGTFAELKKGDIVKFVNNTNNNMESFIVRIRKIIKYDSFEEYLINEGLKRTLPGMNRDSTIKDGTNIYYKYYTKEQEKKFGVLAIYIKIKK
jgi:ASC-1-like (ASCH) protein